MLFRDAKLVAIYIMDVKSHSVDFSMRKVS